MSTNDDLKLVWKNPDSLTPHPSNSRLHDDEQIAQLAASLQEFGFAKASITVDENDLILTGHGVTEAAKALGLDRVPVTVKKGLTEAQKHAFVIADNKLALNSKWDQGRLASEFKELEGSIDLEVLGFTDKEVEALLKPASGNEGSGDGDDKKNYSIGYNIVFDSEEQQEVWFALLRGLKDRYPTDETIGTRLARFIRDAGFGE